VAEEATAGGGAGVSLDGVYSNLRCLLLPHAGEPGYVELLQRLQRFVQLELAGAWDRLPTMRGNGTCDPLPEQREGDRDE
jgi:hypothetical protein